MNRLRIEAGSFLVSLACHTSVPYFCAAESKITFVGLYVLQMALTVGDRQLENDSVEGDLLGETVLQTTLLEAGDELLVPVRLGLMRQHLRHRRLNEAVRYVGMRCAVRAILASQFFLYDVL